MPLSRDDGLAWLRRGLPEVGGHDAVRRAAKDWATFSSDLQGDADVRDYRQVPLEVDPPRHRGYRDILLPFFGRVEVAAMEPAIREEARALVQQWRARGTVDAVHDLAFPLVLRSLAVAFRRRADLDEWASWGLETWITRPDGSRDGAHLDAYLARVVDEAMAAPDARGDVFARIAASTLEGRRLSREEVLGLCNLVLAGGRDTVIKLIVCVLWHLATAPAARAQLAAHPVAIPAAIDEWLRYMSPLPSMEREVRADTTLVACAPGDRVRLSFVDANHDPAVFACPGELRLDRTPNHHVAFGAGPHTCVGAHLAKTQTRVVVEEVLAAVPQFVLACPPDADWHEVRGVRLPRLFRRVMLTAQGEPGA